MGKAGFPSETLPDDSDEYIDRDGDPYLSLHGVLAGALERLDAQVLFDPFEKQFQLPRALVNLRDGQCG